MSWAEDTKLRLQVFAIVLAVLCPILLIWQMTETMTQIASSSWPSVPGEIQGTVAKAWLDKDRTIKYYNQIVKSGPYSSVGPQAQMNIGAAQENKWVKDYPEAAHAYERVADRYSDQPIAGEALFKAGQAYLKQASTAEYDQSVSAQAIATFSDFNTLFPEHEKGAEAKSAITSLRTEQARGSYQIARYYEKRSRWEGAQIYFNEVLIKDPDSKLAEEARRRIEEIKKRLQK